MKLLIVTPVDFKPSVSVRECERGKKVFLEIGQQGHDLVKDGIRLFVGRLFVGNIKCTIPGTNL